MVDSLSYFLFQPVLHNWCNKGHGMCYPVCGMVHITELLLLIGKSNPYTCYFYIYKRDLTCNLVSPLEMVYELSSLVVQSTTGW